MLSYYLCGLCSRNRNRDRTDSTDGKEMTVNSKTLEISNAELDELTRPSEINLQLEVAIGLWETSIHEYESLENHYVDTNKREVLEVKSALRDNPHSFLTSPHDAVRKLALKRIEVFENEKKINRSKSRSMKIQAMRSTSSNGTKSPLVAEDSSMPSFYQRASMSDPSHLLKRASGAASDGSGGVESRSVGDGHSMTGSGSGGDRESLTRIQRRISTTWAAHVQNLDGNLVPHAMPDALTGRHQHSKTGGASTRQMPAFSANKIRPRWPDFLLDVSFEVLKVNSVGKKLRRSIKLTEYHILNIKDEGNQVSKVHKYVEISEIWLENANMFRLKLKDNTVLSYISPISSHIVQQISTRVKTRLALDKTVFCDPVVDFGSLPANLESLVAAISAENSADNTSSMLSFATELGGIALKYSKPVGSGSSTPGSGGGTRPVSSSRPVSFGVKALPDDSLSCTSDASSTIVSDVKSQNSAVSQEGRQSSSKPKLFALREGMGEYRVQVFVRSRLFDLKEGEGSTRQEFIDTFKRLNKTLRDVRSFIDGMHGYILTTRGIELATLLLNDPTPGLRSSSSREVSITSSSHGQSFSASDSGNGAVLAGLVSSSASQNPILNTTSSSSSSSSSSLTAPVQVNDLTDLDVASIASLSFIVFTVVEEAVFLPLSDQIKGLLPSGAKKTEDAEFLDKLRQLRSRKQEEWGIPSDLTSPLGWQNSIFELSAMEHHLTPSMHLLALSRAMNAIYSEFKLVVMPSLSAKGIENVFLGADDLVPIFLYVLSRSDLRSPILYKDQMWALCHPGQLIGECGYYLTVFESAIEYIKDADPDSNDLVFKREVGVEAAVDGEDEDASSPRGGDVADEGEERQSAADSTIKSGPVEGNELDDVDDLPRTSGSASSSNRIRVNSSSSAAGSRSRTSSEDPKDGTSDGTRTARSGSNVSTGILASTGAALGLGVTASGLWAKKERGMQRENFS